MSQEHVSPDPELKTVESALGALKPSPSRIDRDRVMFLAGQAAARRRSIGYRTWVAVAASLGLVSLVEAGMLARRPEVVERVVYVTRPDISPDTAPPDRLMAERDVPTEPRRSGGDFALAKRTHDALTAQLLRDGLDALPALPTSSWGGHGPSPVSSHQLLKEELRKMLDPGGPS